MKVLQDCGYQGVFCVEVDCLRQSWEEDQAVVISLDYLRSLKNSILCDSESELLAVPEGRTPCVNE